MATISHAIRVRAPRDQVFEAITTREGIQNWYTPRVEGDFVSGGEVSIEAYDGEQFRWRLQGETPGSRVEWECVAGPGAAAGTRVVHQLDDTPDGRTAVRVDHLDWNEDDDLIPTCNTIWGILLGSLRDYVETGQRRPAFD